MTQFVVSHKAEEIDVVSNKDNQPLRLVSGPQGFNPFVVQGALWQGTLRISVRQHFYPKTNSKVLLPSKNGIDLVPEAAEALAHAILQVLDELRNPTPQDQLLEAARDLGATVTQPESEPHSEPESEGEIPI